LPLVAGPEPLVALPLPSLAMDQTPDDSLKMA
jgi:hypothetical protein